MDMSTAPSSMQLLADVLDSVPADMDAGLPISRICEAAGVPKQWADGYGRSVLAILRLFDLVQLSDLSGSPEGLIKARSPAAGYFVKSLVAYLRDGTPIVSNWERLGAADENYAIHELLSGPQLLYAMEIGRTAGKDAPVPIRRTEIVVAFIKARIRFRKDPMFLVQYDAAGRQYQLIGGHVRVSDRDPAEAMRREIEEELHLNQFRFGNGDKLFPLGTRSFTTISPAFGVATEYALPMGFNRHSP